MGTRKVPSIHLQGIRGPKEAQTKANVYISGLDKIHGDKGQITYEYRSTVIQSRDRQVLIV